MLIKENQDCDCEDYFEWELKEHHRHINIYRTLKNENMEESNHQINARVLQS